ncbi:hypothetical protein CLU97_3344 [Chryseobacterium sp. 7]|uniref:hypothetical protein n=1 Tax=Chryseobacterium sp. 7 TaxID=2035214 RepID=UPI000EB1921E|nr:hypothetical protein [Chryseobacterium sp. 7]RLJ33855.1 hypothetical protein CLU97_3344 [Chryseobacterium sp. 7]
MQMFPYLSPVRFYPNESYLTDMNNPENTVFWGKRADIHFLNAYQLEINAIHRFPIPSNWGNAISTIGLKLYLRSGNNDYPLSAIFDLYNEKISCITFKCDEFLCGRLVIKDTGNEILVSNEVKFVDSSDGLGRKYITLSSRHSYSINRFPFDDENCWFHTTIPAYCLGETSVELELEHNRIGGVSSKKVKESYSDFVTTYEIASDCDNNILNFIENAGRNNLFFIDGIQKSLSEKIERTDKNATGVLKVVNVLDNDGNNITLDSTNIFDNTKPFVKKIYYNIDSVVNPSFVPIDENNQIIDFNTLTSIGIRFRFEFNHAVKVKDGVVNIGQLFRNGILESSLTSSVLFPSSIINTSFIPTNSFVPGDVLTIKIFADVFENSLQISNDITDPNLPNVLELADIEIESDLTWPDGTKILRSVTASSNLAIYKITSGSSVFNTAKSQYSTDGINWIDGNTNPTPNTIFFTQINTPGWYYLRVEITDIYNNKTYTNVLRQYVYSFNTPECKFHYINVFTFQPTDLLEIEYFGCKEPIQGSPQYGVYKAFSELVGDIQNPTVDFCAFIGTPIVRLNGNVIDGYINALDTCNYIEYNPVQAIPAGYSSPIDPNVIGSSICYTGNQWTKEVKLSGHPSSNPFIFLMDGVTPATPGYLSSFDSGGASGFNSNGIRWIRFAGLPGGNVIYDVNPVTGQITGVSQTYNCI